MSKNTFNMYTKVNIFIINALHVARRGTTTCPQPTSARRSPSPRGASLFTFYDAHNMG